MLIVHATQLRVANGCTDDELWWLFLIQTVSRHLPLSQSRPIKIDLPKILRIHTDLRVDEYIYICVISIFSCQTSCLHFETSQFQTTQRNGCFKFDFVLFISSTSSARFCRFLNYSWRHLWHFDSLKLFSKMRNAWLWAYFFTFEMNTCTVDDLSLFITSWTDLHMSKHLNGSKKSNFSLMLFLLQLNCNSQFELFGMYI